MLIVPVLPAAVLFIVIRLCRTKNHAINRIRGRIHTNDSFYESRSDSKRTSRDLTCIIAPCMAAMIYIILRVSGEPDTSFS